MVTPFALFIIRLFRFATLEGMKVPAEDPPKDKLDVERVIRLSGVPAIGGPLSVSILGPTAKEPAVRVRTPLMDKLAPNVIFLLVLKLFSPFAITFKVISEPVPIVRLDDAPPVKEPAP